MPGREEDIHIRSSEVQEILERVPNWMTRWGITLILLVILALLTVSWFIKYPDIVAGQVMITTKSAPIRLVSKLSGQIEKLYVHEGGKVNEGTEIATIHSPLDKEGVEWIKEVLFEVNEALKAKREMVIPPLPSTYLGAADKDYHRLIENCKLYHRFQQFNTYTDQRQNLRFKIASYEQIIAISERELTIGKEELQLGKERFEITRKNYEQKAIAKLDFLNAQSTFNQLQKSNEAEKKMLVNARLSLQDFKNQLKALEYEYQEKVNTFRYNIKESVNVLNSHTEEWKEINAIVSPVKGWVSFTERYTENEFVDYGEEICVVIPDDMEVLAIASIDKYGFGKVDIGQKVKIKLDNYPYEEFGFLEGRIKNISQVLADDQYRVTIELANGLISSFSKELGYKPEMTGIAEIETRDLSLFDRFFDKLNTLKSSAFN